MGAAAAELERRVELLSRELAEARAQQAATSELLRVISRSAFDLDAVLTSLVGSAIRLCAAARGVIWLYRGPQLHLAAHVGYAPEWLDYARANPITPAADSATMSGLAAFTGEVVNVEDIPNDPRFRSLAAHGLGNYRAGLSVPLKRDGRTLGVLSLSRPEPRLFSPHEIALVESFADQAVIAIENVRLLGELDARTRDLTESLRQQTATAEVLKVISRSAFDLETVLRTLVESAAALCGAGPAQVFRRDGDVYRYAASRILRAEYLEIEKAAQIPPGRGTIVGRVALEKRAVEITDAWSDPEYEAKEEARIGNVRSMLGVPLLRDGEPIGVFALARDRVAPFSPQEVELVTTFADQAVIAIENVRLFENLQARTRDLEEALQQQAATADVLKVISRSAFDLQAVFQALIESAVRLCAADRGVISVRDGDLFRVAAGVGQTPEHIAYEKAHPHPLGRGTLHGRAALERATVHVPDVMLDPEYERRDVAVMGNFRAVVAVPIRRDEEVIGVFGLARATPGPFAPRQIELVETFADQAAIAIGNVRLFEEVQSRTTELARSLAELRSAQDRLVQTEKLASLGQLTAGIAHEIKNPLNFVNNFAALSEELIDELRELLDKAGLDAALRAEVGELADTLKGNLGKVVQHGRRADSIVKNMLLHSRAGSGERRPSDVNGIVEEALNLAYHGARAEKPGFNIALERNLDPAAGKVELFPQEITRVLLNLISNGFYAAMKRKADGDGAYDPRLTASTRDLGDRVEIRVRDNGTGIPAEVKERMFNPFFTTKPAGEGTGLGLSISHDIIVKQHGGSIEVETEPGAFTEFRIVLPRGAAAAARAERPA